MASQSWWSRYCPADPIHFHVINPVPLGWLHDLPIPLDWWILRLDDRLDHRSDSLPATMDVGHRCLGHVLHLRYRGQSTTPNYSNKLHLRSRSRKWRLRFLHHHGRSVFHRYVRPIQLDVPLRRQLVFVNLSFWVSVFLPSSQESLPLWFPCGLSSTKAKPNIDMWSGFGVSKAGVRVFGGLCRGVQAHRVRFGRGKNLAERDSIVLHWKSAIWVGRFLSGSFVEVADC